MVSLRVSDRILESFFKLLCMKLILLVGCTPSLENQLSRLLGFLARTARPLLTATGSRRASGSSCNMKVSVLAISTRIASRDDRDYASAPSGRALRRDRAQGFFSHHPLAPSHRSSHEPPLTPLPSFFPRSSTLLTPPRGSRRSLRSPMSPSCECFPTTRIGSLASPRRPSRVFSCALANGSC